MLMVTWTFPVRDSTVLQGF